MRAHKFFISIAFTFLHIKASELLWQRGDYCSIWFCYALKEAETSQLEQLYIVCEDCTYANTLTDIAHSQEANGVNYLRLDEALSTLVHL